MASTYYTIGSKGDEVKKLQQTLTNAGYDTKGVDGIFGANTQAAVTAYQKANNLTQDGIAGSQTLGSLYKPAATTQTIPQINQAAPVAPKQPAVDLSALSNINLNPTVTVPTYETPFQDKLNSALDKILSYNPNSAYDVTTDPLYAPLKQQYDNAGQSAFNNQIGRLSALTGGRPSTAAVGTATASQNQYAKDFAGTVLPSLVSAEQTRKQNEYNNIINQLEALQGADNTGYNRFRDTTSDTQKAEEKKISDYLSTIGQYSDNYQARINVVENDNDPTNDYESPLLKAKRQEKIAAQEAAKAEAEQLAYEREVEQAKLTNDTKLTNAQISNYAADNARQAASGGSSTTDITSLGTPQQLNYFNNAFNYLLEKNGDDGYKAYQQLLRESKDYNASMGGKLYTELGKQLQAYGKSQGTPTSINNAVTASVDDLTGVIKTRFVKPATQDEEQVIDYQGIADYLEQLINAGADKAKTDELARIWGLNID